MLRVRAHPGADAVEAGEYCAAVADADMECDLDRQWKKVQSSLQKAELLAAQKARVESSMRQAEGFEGFVDGDLDARMQQAMAEAGQAAGQCHSNLERMQNRLERTNQDIQATLPPPGVAAASGVAQQGPQ